MARFVQVTETAYYVEEGDPVWMAVITDPMRFVKVEARDEEDLAEFLATEPGDVLFVRTMVDFLTPDSVPMVDSKSKM